MISYNIGHTSKLTHSGVLSYHPIHDDVTLDQLRNGLNTIGAVKNLFEWADHFHVPPSEICIFVTDDNGDHHTIMAVDVPLYRKKWERKYKKQYNPPE